MLLIQRFVQVQQHVADHGPGRQLGRVVRLVGLDARWWPSSRPLRIGLVMLTLRFEQCRSIARLRSAVGCRASTWRNAYVARAAVSAASCSHDSPRQRLGRFDVNRIVQQRERRHRRVRGDAANRARFAARGVERHRRRVRTRPPPERVQPAAIAVVALRWSSSGRRCTPPATRRPAAAASRSARRSCVLNKPGNGQAPGRESARPTVGAAARGKSADCPDRRRASPA